MDLAQPYRALTPTVNGDILVQLARSTKPRTGRELARLSKRSEAGVRHQVARLVEQGLVHVEQTPGGRLYTLNRDHLAAPIVGQIAALRLALFERLRGQISDWRTSPVHASVFGSAARGDGDVHSDIDLFVVRPQDTSPEAETWREQLDDLADCVYRWTGNHAGISEVGEEDLPRLRRERPPVVEELLTDAVHLVGEQAPRLLGAGHELP
ncbi:MAG: nucleotidyltransferase domain-containing protein [Solirubrobacterales bacterium]